jgi:hypothetical protein
MTGKFQPKGSIYELSSDIPLNWSDMRSVFEYKLLCSILHPHHLNIMLRYTISMKKNFWQWAIGDVFTKIAGGIFGGSVVALYYNAFVLTPEKTIELYSPFLTLVIIAIFLSLCGYFIIQRTDAD